MPVDNAGVWLGSGLASHRPRNGNIYRFSPLNRVQGVTLYRGARSAPRSYQDKHTPRLQIDFFDVLQCFDGGLYNQKYHRNR